MLLILVSSFILAVPGWQGSAPPSTDDRAKLSYDLLRHFVQGEFAVLERYSNDFRRLKSRWPNSDWKLWDFFEVFGEDIPNFAAVQGLLERWEAEFPRSANPKIILASQYINWAWKARGGGYADSVSDAAWKEFHENLLKADEALKQAESRDPGNPGIYFTWVPVTMGIHGEEKQLWQVVRKGIKAEPSYYHLYKQAGNYFLPKWSGRPEALAEFGDKVYREVSRLAGKEIAAEMYSALAEVGFSEMEDNVLKSHKFSWPRIKEGYTSWMKKFPGAYRRQNYFCMFAVSAKDKATAKLLFQKIGPWKRKYRSVWGSEQQFNQWRTWAQR